MAVIDNSTLMETRDRSKGSFCLYPPSETKAGRNEFGAHWHSDFEIMYMDFDGVAQIDSEIIEFKRGDAVFVNKERIHTVTAHSDGLLYVLIFDFEYLDFSNDDFCQAEIIDALKNKVYLFPRFSDLSVELREEITAILQNIITVYASDIRGKELKIKCYIYEMIFLLYSHDAFIVRTGNRANPMMFTYVKNMITFMEQNFTKLITIDDMSKSIGISKYYFIKIFKQVTGVTPIIYLKNLRVNSSKEFLTKGYSVTDACFISGFNNVSYYIRKFKEQSHITPKQFQNEKSNL